MSEHLFEYISIIILIIGVSLYLLRHQIKGYFKSPSVHAKQSKFKIKVKNGYLSLLNLLYHNSNKDDLEREIRYIASQRTDGRYLGGYTRDTHEFDVDSFVLDYFYEILNYTDSKNENFILTIDPNFTIEVLNDKLIATLGKLSNSIDLPHTANKDLKSTLLDYKKSLNKHNIQMTFISDGSDAYYALIYPLAKEKAIYTTIENIGFQPKELN
jgi:hypothetical protein